jgi:hypothetical protein
LKTLIARVLDQHISGRRIEPDEADIIRTVGNYDNGRCLRRRRRRTAPRPERAAGDPQSLR